MYQVWRVLGLLSLRRHSGGVSGMENKGYMYIDGQRVPFDGEPNVMLVIRKAGIYLPTFCYYSDLSVYGACRMCVVEDERGKIETSCSMQPRDGLKIRTNTARLLKHRRMILELMLASQSIEKGWGRREIRIWHRNGKTLYDWDWPPVIT